MARRNNQARLGAAAPDEDLEIQDTDDLTVTPPAKPLSFVVPTDIVKLPSGGSFYPKKHPLHGKKTVEVKFMTAKEEDILTSQSLLENGLALDRLVQSIVVDKDLNAKTLLIGDKNAILINARKNGYGPDYTTTLTCPECTEPQEATYDLDSAVLVRAPSATKLKAAKVGTTDEGQFTVTLPLSQVKIVFRLLTSKDESVLMTVSEKRRKRKMAERAVTDQLKLMVVSANGETDPDTLNQFVQSLTLKDSRSLREAYELVSPGVQMKEVFVCGACAFEDEIDFPVTTDFFWPQ